MPTYIVRWEIEIDADTPREAVEFAIDMLPIAHPEDGQEHTLATVFDVLDPDDESLIQQIDISE